MIQLTDRSYQHQAGFFDTMIARTYVGYGTSTLGLPSIDGQVGDADTPSTWILPNSLTGTPGSYLQGSMALPGTMMNHFVLSNWYDPTNGSHCQKSDFRNSFYGSRLKQADRRHPVNRRYTLNRLVRRSVGSPWELTLVEDGVIPTGSDSHYNSAISFESKTLDISNEATNTSNGTDFVLTGRLTSTAGQSMTQIEM